jgi:hypothetical protein
MNLFILSENKQESAIFHTDRHIVKMPTELSQMLSFAYHKKEVWDCEIPSFIMRFSKTHDRHPCSIWITESLSNWLWSAQFGLELYNEYQYRYNKPDKHQRARLIFEFCLNNAPKIKDIGLTPFAQAINPECKIYESPIDNYRLYYLKEKNHLFKWTKRDKPDWITSATNC